LALRESIINGWMQPKKLDFAFFTYNH